MKPGIIRRRIEYRCVSRRIVDLRVQAYRIARSEGSVDGQFALCALHPTAATGEYDEDCRYFPHVTHRQGSEHPTPPQQIEFSQPPTM